MKLFHNRRPTVRAVGVLAAATTLTLGTWAGTALAHGGTGTLEVEGHPDEMHVTATWDDGDPIADATAVTAVPTSSSGEEGSPINLEGAGDGTYAGSYDGLEPGDYSMVVTLFHADAEGGQIEATQTLTVGEGGASAGEATETTAAPTDTTAAAEDDGATAAPETEEAADEDDGGGSMVLVIILVVVVVAIVGAVIWAVKGRGEGAEA